MSQRQFKRIKRFVVLRYLQGPTKGMCFWSTAIENGGDNTGSIILDTYEEVAFTDDQKEAIAMGPLGFLKDHT